MGGTLLFGPRPTEDSQRLEKRAAAAPGMAHVIRRFLCIMKRRKKWTRIFREDIEMAEYHLRKYEESS